MKLELVPFLVCPKCRRPLDVRVDRQELKEVIEGSLVCGGCASSYPITSGIPRFLPDQLSKDKQATAEAFGYEWTHYSTLTSQDKKEFLGWVAPLTPADFAGRLVLDVGCGKGRHIFLAAQFGARMVVGVDLSNAVDAAYQNTRSLENVHVIQADALSLPFSRPFDLAYSVGVLHHLPIPKDGFESVAGHVRPGGRIATWVYGKEGNLWIEKLVDPVRKNITSRLPRSITRALSFPAACVLYATLKLLYRPAKRSTALKRLLPYSEYLCSISDYSFAENFWNVFDQLVAPTAFYISEHELSDWYTTIQGQQVRISRHNNNSWRGTALIPSTESDKHATGVVTPTTSNQKNKGDQTVFPASVRAS
jgi:SAM-dependent methyltransferase